MASTSANTKSIQKGEGIFIGRNVLREMQGEEDCTRRSDHDGEDCQGPQHDACNVPDVRHQDDEVHEVEFILGHVWYSSNRIPQSFFR
jgi:hypothetical protein